MYCYIVVSSDDSQIQASCTFDLETLEYGSPNITFSRDGEEIDFWDNPLWIDRFMDHLKYERWGLLRELLETDGVEVPLEYLKDRRVTIMNVIDAIRTKIK